MRKVVQIFGVSAALFLFPISIKTQWNNYLPCDGQIAWAGLPASLDAADLNFSASFTIEGWVYFNQAEAPVTILSLRRDDDALIYRLGKESGPRFYFDVTDVHGKTWRVMADEAAPIGEWVHVAGVLQKEDDAVDALALYVGGRRLSLVSEKIELAPEAIIQKQRSVLRLAGEPAGQIFSGSLDEVRISATARYTEPTISALDNTLPVDAATIALWHFDEPFGAAIAADASLRGFDLSLTRSASPWAAAIDDFSASTYGAASLLLSWQTKNERELVGFEVQRRHALESFECVGFLPAHNFGNQKSSYDFTDMPSSNGRYYYRLKTLDASGQYRFSPEVGVNFLASAR